MNVSNNSIDISIMSTDLTTTICDESSLNLNRNVSDLEISNLTEHSISMQMTTKESPSQCKLSITLDSNEKEMLKRAHDMQSSVPNVLTMSHIDDLEESKILNGPTIAEEDDAVGCSILSVQDQSSVQELANTVAKTMDTTGSYMVDTLPSNERHFFQNSFVEMGRRLWKSDAQAQHYTKGCLWSPDGTCALVPVHLDGMHVVELPTDLYQVDYVDMEREVSELSTAVHVKEGGTVYDFAWYPLMSSEIPETCFWIATRQHEPIHMWDAFNGELRCTYRGYDEVDEVESAISVIFSNPGDKIIAGYKKSIKIFDTSIPGRDCDTIPVKQAISCFGLSGSNDDTITVGSWNGYIHHYDLRVPKLGALFTLNGHNGGITWLRYAPNDSDWMLFSGARKDNKILQWDMRNYSQPVREFQRNVSTNQRIYFDLSPLNEWLVSGDTNGLLRIWDLCGNTGESQLELHGDCCNGVHFHPTRPILATTAGQYHFMNVTEDEDDEGDPNKSSTKKSNSKEAVIDYENSLMFSWFGKSQNSKDKN